MSTVYLFFGFHFFFLRTLKKRKTIFFKDLRAIRHEKVYPCCEEAYVDLTFTCTVKRKSLFYMINLIVPCINISILAVLVFLLPSDSKQKITFSVSILVALLVFYLFLVDLIPPISLVVPLLGKYLLLTLVLVNLSIIMTIITLNVHFRRHSTTYMASWLRKILLIYLPRSLLVQRPIISTEYSFIQAKSKSTYENQRKAYPWKNERRRQIAEIIENHVAYIAKQIQNAKIKKDVRHKMNYSTLEV